MGCQRLTYHQKTLWKTENTPIFVMGQKQGGDYQVFGVQMPGRSFNSGDYRYGFHGMEQDPELKGSGNSYTTEFRQYDPRLGRWLSRDPLFHEFPWQSPYVAFDNNPIYYRDPKGLAAVGGDDPVEVEGIDYSQSASSNLEFSSNNNGIQAPQMQTYEINQNTTPMEQMPKIEYSFGRYLIDYIQDLPYKPGGFPNVPVFSSTGLKPTYENSTAYRNCDGNCYMASAGRVNAAYSTWTGIVPIDIEFKSDGTVRTKDYQLASSQSRASDRKYYGYGVGGVLAQKGFGTVVDDIGAGLKPGAQIQIWYGSVGGSGHSVMFMGYGENDKGAYLRVIDNHGLERGGPTYEGGPNEFGVNDTFKVYMGVNILDP